MSSTIDCGQRPTWTIDFFVVKSQWSCWFHSTHVKFTDPSLTQLMLSPLVCLQTNTLNHVAGSDCVKIHLHMGFTYDGIHVGTHHCCVRDSKQWWQRQMDLFLVLCTRRSLCSFTFLFTVWLEVLPYGVPLPSWLGSRSPGSRFFFPAVATHDLHMISPFSRVEVIRWWSCWVRGPTCVIFN